MIEKATADDLKRLFPRHVYRGAAVGVGANMTGPVPAAEVVAASALPVVGGQGLDEAAAGVAAGVVRFQSAKAATRGVLTRGVFETVASSDVRGVDVNGVVTAQRIAATLRSRRKEPGGPAFYEEEVTIQGLTVGGRPVGLDDSAVRLIRKFPTFEDLVAGYAKNDSLRKLIDGSCPPGVRKTGRLPRGEGDNVHVGLLKPDTEKGAWFAAIPIIVDQGSTRYFVFIGEHLISRFSRRLTVLRVVMRPLPARARAKTMMATQGEAVAAKATASDEPLEGGTAIGEVEVNGHGDP